MELKVCQLHKQWLEYLADKYKTSVEDIIWEAIREYYQEDFAPDEE